MQVKTATPVDANVMEAAREDDAEASWAGHRRRKAVHGHEAKKRQLKLELISAYQRRAAELKKKIRGSMPARSEHRSRSNSIRAGNRGWATKRASIARLTRIGVSA